MRSAAEELEAKTLTFWNTSLVFHTGTGKPLSFGDAIQECNMIAEVLGPQRPLRNRFYGLQDRLIQGRGKRRKTSKHPDNVRVLRIAKVQVAPASAIGG